MACSSHAWERPDRGDPPAGKPHDWENDSASDLELNGDDGPGSEDSDSDTECRITKGDKFVNYVLELFEERTLNARQVCTALR